MQKEIEIVWRILSSMILLLFVYLLTFNSSFILSHLPKCYSIKLYNKPCIFCGMSRAFIMIKNFNFILAVNYNKWSLILFFSFFINSIFFISSFKKK
jgi:hypothetical protein